MSGQHRRECGGSNEQSMCCGSELFGELKLVLAGIRGYDIPCYEITRRAEDPVARRGLVLRGKNDKA